MKVLTTSEVDWNYFTPPDTSAKCLLLTDGGIAIIGQWRDGNGLLAWLPLPKRNKEYEPLQFQNTNQST